MVSGDILDQPGAPVVVVEDDPAVVPELSGTSNGLAVFWVEVAD
jgi:hypothetical protein